METQQNKILPWVTLVFRVLVGALFIYSGLSKLLAPHEEFLAIAEEYKLFSGTLLQLYTWVLPWVELLAGTFFLLGWYQKWSAWVLLLMLVSFIIALLSLMIRGIELANCGCFGGTLGQLLGETAPEVFARDVVLFVIIIFVSQQKKNIYSLDSYFSS